ncbi:FAD-linked oxidoreductase [Eremomyces bilateralis CBS 781.70]|uniref:Proline dehydrogenase n=1 Tax=Eremomyces bilateralis CBS 781.70 TaxID=1392243 RepID=A0A6G1FUM6_9PEZI|nr:FAD-linked oxidoreductase [Eremomyces bilateralis CBS 781.70]KAF1809392.1 FAD-linked oxidoreductase [Eremomyces bilateralis CBS 781.70]
MSWRGLPTAIIWISRRECAGGVRKIHTSNRKTAATASIGTLPGVVAKPKSYSSNSSITPLSILPTPNVLRTYLIASVTASPLLLRGCFAVLNRLLESKSTIIDVDRNPILRQIFKQTLYAQFCAGETKEEVRRTTSAMKSVGFDGIILEYALELLLDEKATNAVDPEVTKSEIATWKQGMTDSVDMTDSGEFVGLKWSGLGTEALRLLRGGQLPSPAMEQAIHEICDHAAAKNVKLLPSAEEESTNIGIDRWTQALQKKYNRDRSKGAILYNTYQAYLTSCPGKLARGLAEAEQEGYTLGVKLVRGAYMSSEPRSNIWSSKEETDKAYDELTESLIRRKYLGRLQPHDGSEGHAFPNVSIMLATHNQTSVRKAQEIRNELATKGEQLGELAYAQLYGMADEIGCQLVQNSKAAKRERETIGVQLDMPRTFKLVAWGTTKQCLHFLYRRARENQDAIARTKETKQAMWEELVRRMKALVVK